MNYKIEEGLLIIDNDGVEYRFDAHGEKPRPSMLGLGISAGGKHWSNRDPEIKLEKHSSVQDVTLGNDLVAWYIQEFIPDGIDYKISKNAKIYIGVLSTGEHKLIYKGECYGDMCFDDRILYFNMGNKIASVNVDNGEVQVLFKHSGIKKNGTELKVTDKRIFYTHWTKDKNYLMWYDRQTKEIINPHIDTYKYYILDDNTIIFQSLYHTWICDMQDMKKSRFFSSKKRTEILKLICNQLEIPLENYKQELNIELKDFNEGRLYFKCESRYKSVEQELLYDENKWESFGKMLPFHIEAEASCDTKTDNISVKLPENTVSVLIENTTTHPQLKAEHGLSLAIYYKCRLYILDTGSSGDFFENARRMRIYARRSEMVVLSHGHYDHAGGLQTLFGEEKDVYVCAMKSAIQKYYSGSGGNIHEIGIPQDIIDEYGDRFIFIEENVKIGRDIYLIPHATNNLNKIGEKAKLYKMVNDELVPDDFSHELSLVLDSEKGLIIFNSCSHAGVVNIIKEIKELWPDEKIYAFFGGLHMKGKCGDEIICTFSEEEIKEIAEYLNSVGLQKLYTGHCTGEPAINLLKKYLGDKVEVMSTGMRICI